jgi:hypothetical protein
MPSTISKLTSDSAEPPPTTISKHASFVRQTQSDPSARAAESVPLAIVSPSSVLPTDVDEWMVYNAPCHPSPPLANIQIR